MPDIPNKLIKPPLRNSLARQRKDFWDIVIQHNGPVNCIYAKVSKGIPKKAWSEEFKTNLVNDFSFFLSRIEEATTPTSNLVIGDYAV